MIVTGILHNIDLDTQNINGRFYSSDVMKKVVEKYQEKINKGIAFGEFFLQYPLDNPGAMVNLENVSHKITALEVFENVVNVEALLLDTPMGMRAQDLLSDTPIFVARSLASLDENNVVQDDLEILTVDIANPN
jgi:hypothetical protein